MRHCEELDPCSLQRVWSGGLGTHSCQVLLAGGSITECRGLLLHRDRPALPALARDKGTLVSCGHTSQLLGHLNPCAYGPKCVLPGEQTKYSNVGSSGMGEVCI